ncbi:hypothetical protein P0C28_09915 [Aeromonas hydrophila]|uniref:DUF6988 family protein n=1 Tax=Aeromonas hydrophila TaxID=644 RepID=UPI0023AF2E8E|nr:hypothetical protein [Aeromonas hydrophila]MDE8809579.1 hypothetical protein [Aeromonas hydrophila]
MNSFKTDQLFARLSEVVDHPIYNDDTRTKLSLTLTISSMQFSDAVRLLCSQGLILGIGTTLRSQYEALVRSVWVLYCATDLQVEKLDAVLNTESQQASKNIPTVNAMLGELDRIPQIKNLLISFHEFKDSSWLPLNSFVHSGIHAVFWTKHKAPPELIEQLFRISNGLNVIAFQEMGIFTGRQNIQKEIFSVIAHYSDCLPKPR